MISIIVAQSNNRVIGLKNELPWYLPNDLKRFKELTTGRSVIMGRNTYQAIVNRLGHPLPNRHNIVISTTLEPQEGITLASSLDDALSQAPEGEEVFVIGGERLYREALELATRLYLTQVDAEIEGDTYFPEIDSSEWHTLALTDNPVDDRHPYPYQFIVLERG